MATSPIDHDCSPPEYLILGHVTKDLTRDGPGRGGTCSYAGITASRLGPRVAIATAGGPDIPESHDFRAIPIEWVRHPLSTTFENIYKESGRRQNLYAVSGQLSFDMIPQVWRHPPIVHLAPMAREFSPILCRCFRREPSAHDDARVD